MVSSGASPWGSHSESHSRPTFVPYRQLPRDPLASRLSNLSLAMPTIWETARDTLLDIPSPTSTLTPTPPSTPTPSPTLLPPSQMTFELGSSLSLQTNDSTSSLITQRSPRSSSPSLSMNHQTSPEPRRLRPSTDL